MNSLLCYRRTFELGFTRWSRVKKLEDIQKSSNGKHQFLTKWVFQAAYICIIWMLRQMRVSVIINSFSKSFYKWCSEWVRTFYWTLSIILKSEQSRRQFIPKAQNYWRILTWKNTRWSWSTADIKKHSFHPGNPKNITTFFNLHTTEPLGWNSWCHMLPMDAFWML